MPNTREESLLRAKSICDAYDSSEFKTNVKEQISIAEKTTSVSDESSVDKHKYAATLLTQFRWLLWRNFTNDRRQPISKILLVQVIVSS